MSQSSFIRQTPAGITPCIIFTTSYVLYQCTQDHSKFHVNLPILRTTQFYCRELDELEREDFTRLKMVKKKKEEQIKQSEIDKKEADLASAEDASKTVLKVLPVVPVAAVAAKTTTETPSLLHGFDASDDQDIVFK